MFVVKMASELVEVSDGPLQTKLSHKQWKKLKRKQKRQALSQQKKEQTPSLEGSDEEERLRRAVEEENARQNAAWEAHDRQAHLLWQNMKEQEERDRLKQEEQNRRIREEWEERERREKEEEEKILKAQSKRREKQDSLLKKATENEHKEWHNPLAPASYSNAVNSSSEEILRDVNRCPFFTKTGTCRFGDRCSRVHVRPDSSTTILIPGMFENFELMKSSVDDYDTDFNLEYEDNEMYQSFRDFYYDVVPEFKTVGKVVNIKVCCNHEPHLRGNVYVQYKRESEANAAFVKFNARWYAGRQMSCEFVNIPKWKSAICGLFFAKRCPKGKNCNFMHVFRNPGNEFWDADRDFEVTSRRDTRDREATPRWQTDSERRGYRRRGSRSRSRSRTRESSRSYKSRHRSTRDQSRSPVSRSQSRRKSTERETASGSRRKRHRKSASRETTPPSQNQDPYTYSSRKRKKRRSPRSRSRSGSEEERRKQGKESPCSENSPSRGQNQDISLSHSRKRKRRSRSRSGSGGRGRVGVAPPGENRANRSRSSSDSESVADSASHLSTAAKKKSKKAKHKKSSGKKKKRKDISPVSSRSVPGSSVRLEHLKHIGSGEELTASENTRGKDETPPSSPPRCKVSLDHLEDDVISGDFASGGKEGDSTSGFDVKGSGGDVQSQDTCIKFPKVSGCDTTVSRTDGDAGKAEKGHSSDGDRETGGPGCVCGNRESDSTSAVDR